MNSGPLRAMPSRVLGLMLLQMKSLSSSSYRRNSGLIIFWSLSFKFWRSVSSSDGRTSGKQAQDLKKAFKAFLTSSLDLDFASRQVSRYS